MISRKLYYGVKPLVPIAVRRGIRRHFALRKLQSMTARWPVLPNSEHPPRGWTGWPDGKKFAFIITHDVEGQSGVDKCRDMMRLEMKYGLRSSYNFIPEGEYRVGKDLRDELTGNGFEVGVHDLHHDGKLYSSRDEFASRAAKINKYLKEWGAVGFRSGFMLHNLDWLLDLDLQYDASTFDTDPFEPQPDEAGTIFPFWKKGMNGRGYVELPYTLAQDSTLFLVLGQSSPAIWLKKFDWVAKHGGMVLVNVHPDYLQFGGNPVKYRTFSAGFYEQLLAHARTNYGGSMWHVLPKQLAAWYGSSEAARQDRIICPSLRSLGSVPNVEKSPRMSGNVAVVIYSYYLADPRPRRETETLVEAGLEADVICLRRDKTEPPFEIVNGVRIHRISLSRRRSGQGSYFWRYGYFFLCAMLKLSWWSLRRKFKLVHVHNMPDFLVFTAWLPRLRGAKVILDLHDPMPELYCGIYETSETSLIYKLLCWMERKSIAFADRVLTPNIAFKQLFSSRSHTLNKVNIVMNSPSTKFFDSVHYKKNTTEGARKFTIMFHGSLVERHGLDMAVEALAKLHGKIPALAMDIYGDHTEYVDVVLEQIRRLKLENVVQFHGYRNQAEIAKIISEIDLGLIPNRLNDFTNINFPTRIFEYLAMGKPVMVPRTRGVADYFAEDEILFFQPGDIDDMARKIEWAYAHPEELCLVLEKGREIYDRNAWPRQQANFLGMVDQLITPPVPPVLVTS